MSGATGMWGRRSPLVAIWPSGVHQLVPQSAETARHLIQVVTGQDCHCCLVRSLAGLSEVLASERGRPQRGAGLREGQASERRRPQRGAGLREAQASERGRPQRSTAKRPSAPANSGHLPNCMRWGGAQRIVFALVDRLPWLGHFESAAAPRHHPEQPLPSFPSTQRGNEGLPPLLGLPRWLQRSARLAALPPEPPATPCTLIRVPATLHYTSESGCSVL
jgi:hypothetical protein